MEYLEAPSISSAERRLVYPIIKWLGKEKFVEYLELARTSPANPEYKIYPFIADPSTEDDFVLDSKRSVFIGKSIPTHDEGIDAYEYGTNEKLELIGSVVYNVKTQDWELRIPCVLVLVFFRSVFYLI